MAFRDFTYPQVLADLGLTLAEADLFGHVPPAAVPAGFAADLGADADLATEVNTEKARSEFLIAPILAYLWRSCGRRFGTFSGVQFDVDAARGLTGFCDFILTRSPILTVLTAPVLTIVEAKNDNLQNGLGQCVAAMAAAREFNTRAGLGGAVYGAITTGPAWKFLRLDGHQLTLNRGEVYVSDLGRVVGILTHILTAG